MQAKYFRISALVLELRMLIFFRSEKKRVDESAIRLSGKNRLASVSDEQTVEASTTKQATDIAACRGG